jgi:hypothetical protein
VVSTASLRRRVERLERGIVGPRIAAMFDEASADAARAAHAGDGRPLLIVITGVLRNPDDPVPAHG